MRTRSIHIAIALLVVTGVCVTAPAQAGTRPSRMPKAPNVMFEDVVATQFLLPVVGSAAGAHGTFWHSSVVIGNFRDVPQRIALTFLPEGGTAAAPVYRSLLEYGKGGDVGLVSDDIVANLGFSGMGALLVQAVDANGAIDSNGKIDGFTRVWTNQPATAGCSSPAGTTSETLLAVPVNSLTGNQWSAFALGARQDDAFRTNVGVVNLSNQAQTFRVNVFGSNNAAEAEFRITVAANSMMQQPLPDGNFGTMSIAFSLEGSNVNNVNWAAYTSSVDNATGDAWSRNASF